MNVSVFSFSPVVHMAVLSDFVDVDNAAQKGSVIWDGYDRDTPVIRLCIGNPDYCLQGCMIPVVHAVRVPLSGGKRVWRTTVSEPVSCKSWVIPFVLPGESFSESVVRHSNRSTVLSGSGWGHVGREMGEWVEHTILAHEVMGS